MNVPWCELQPPVTFTFTIVIKNFRFVKLSAVTNISTNPALNYDLKWLLRTRLT
ncbi:hypothetical protein CBL_02558 [Carabus blaptoides fortunei]